MNYRKGRAAEYRAMRILEAAGYLTARAAGSHGAWDVLAWDRSGVRFIQVKSGRAYASKLEREQLRELVRPRNSSVEIWRFPARCRVPSIERL